jgi:arylsulfatase A-like enzyme
VKFTLVATVRNEAGSIRAFVESLLQQTRVPDEILIVDGDSTDGTHEILEEYAARGELRVISRPCNIAQGRNIGIAAAPGTHVAVTDAGCRVDPHWLEHIERCFRSEEQPDVVAGNFRFETHTPFEEAVVYGTFQPNRDQSDAARYYPSSRSVAFTKAAWQKAGGYPEWLYAAEDTLFNIRMRQIGMRFAFCREAIVRWRPRESWRTLARQRINFSRGNARVGIGSAGYVINLQVHVAFALALLCGALFPPLLAVALVIAGWHVHRHLWPQARRATAGNGMAMLLRVLVVMEFVRLANLYGFLQGRWDRFSDPSYVANQVRYMCVGSVDDLPPDNANQEESARAPLPEDSDRRPARALATLAALSAFAAMLARPEQAWIAAGPVLGVAGVGTLALLIKSLLDFSQTGPRIREEILVRYRFYTLFALARLSAWAFALMTFTGGLGALLYFCTVTAMQLPWSTANAVVASTVGVLVAFCYQFTLKLRFNPGLIVASMHYRMSRFYGLWRWSTPRRMAWLRALLLGGATSALVGATLRMAGDLRGGDLAATWAAAIFFAATIAWTAWEPDARTARSRAPRGAAGRPNIVMIGSDTLRSDRLGALGYHRALTPNIDRLATTGALFGNCYVPCARTAPSLVSMLSGTWPHTHGIRDNFVPDESSRLRVSTLPQLLRAQGYRSAAVSDWCGADLGKFSFGFDYLELPEDQWNLKFLIRQGPKDLRLFVSLFTHNRLGRTLLPEIYYLGGVPLTRPMGRRARRMLSRLAQADEPFLLNVFYSTTHPPFASEWPWYTAQADARYDGESKFAMARLTDPFDIIRRQGAPKEEFDLNQILDLYDGCVAEFDNEVGRMLAHIEACGLASDTIVVVYSDHGMEFFEHDTWGQGNSAVGEASPRIPLLIRAPHLPGSGRLDAVVRSIDVAPTLLELCGVARPEGMEGVSLANGLRSPADLPQLDAFNETGTWIADLPGLPDEHLRYPDLLTLLEVRDTLTGTLSIKPAYDARIIDAKDRMIRSGRWKLTYQPLTRGYRLQLFDLATDPQCQRNVIVQHAELADALWQRLDAWIRSANAGRSVRMETGQ